MADDNRPLSVRIVKVDHYLTKPVGKLDDPCYSGFRSLPIHHVPVIRVFGPTTEGTKTCVHIHGVFPYIYIPNWDHKLKEKDFYSFAASLDKAINTSFACSSSKTCHVHRISVVSRRPYYGYYEDEKEFLKIEFYNPALLKRASDLLLNGAVFNQNYQPYEAHVPYILQFFIDSNLYGMSYVTFSLWQVRSETAKDVLKQTKMSFEVDTSVKHLIQQCLGGYGMPNNPGLAFIWDEERKRKKLLTGESQITPNASQARPSREATRTELYYACKLREKLKRLNRKSSDAQSTPDTVEEEMPEEELNSVGLDILAMLNELAAWNKREGDEKSASSRCSSPSIVFSDNEDESQEVNVVSNMELIRSQPVLKQTAEDDSILGDDFSDDEIDEEDHLLLSHSMNQLHSTVPSDDEFDGEVGNIPQLDGTDDTNTRSNRQAGRERRKNGYNLRSVKTEIRKPKDRKSTPKKQYPQLEIATQMSPKGALASPSVAGSPSCRPSPEASFLNTLFPDAVCSPPTTSPLEGRKSESRRSYPPLDLNFRKSPKSDIKIEPLSNAKRRKMMGGVKKRRIDFDEIPKNDETDTLLTTRWKILQRSKKPQRSSPNRERNNVGEVRVGDIEDLSNLTCAVKDQNKPSEYVLPVNSEMDSQQYNLKIRFDACGSFDREKVLNSLLTKEPVVMVDKLKTLGNYDPIVKSDDEMVYSGESRHQVSGSVSERKEADIATTRSMELDDDQCENGVSKLDKAFRALSAEYSDDSSDESPSKFERDRIDKVLAEPSKSSGTDEGELSSAEVNFGDLGESGSPNSEKPNSAFSQTIIASSCSKTTVELDDEIDRAELPSQENEFLSQLLTPDFINLEAGEFGAIDREAISSSRRDEANIERRLTDSNLHKFDGQRSLGTTCGISFQDDIEAFVHERGAVLKVTESIGTPRNSSSADDVLRRCRNYDDSDPEIFSESSEEYRALVKSPFLPARNRNSSSPANVAHVDKSHDGQRFAFDNSAWDTAEKTSEECNEVLSFYVDDTISVVNATIDCDKEADGVEMLTPENVPGIISWNAGDSVLGDRSTDENSRNKLTSKLSREKSSNDDSPPTPKKCLLSSTPQNASKKTTPSPTYTPILKKLMLKKINAQKVDSRSRFSSHAFQKESLLADIGEEVEPKDNCDVTKKDFSLDATTAAITAEKNTSGGQKSVSSGGSGLIDLTMANTYGFRMSLENLQNVKTETKHQHITVLSVEVFAMTRGNLCPDPELDAVHCIFYSIFHDASETPKLTSGIIVVADEKHSSDLTRFNCEKQFVANENDLFDRFVALVEKWDPDIFVGYEIEMLSWGYIIQRAQCLGRNYAAELSRVREEKPEPLKEKTLVEDNEYSDDLKLVGRIVLNVWRLMRHEITLQSYTFENILFHVLHQRVPKHSFRVLTDWWKNSLRRWIVIDYYLLRAESNITLLQQLDFFGRTSELARLFGIQFYEVLSRGSQFRVESMMLRLAKKHNFVAVSPSVKQRAKMRAPESLPLIMEPESKFYTDPVLVLDFQSLYPSIIIAYNYCFSTCLGRIEHLVEKEKFNLGCIQHTVPAELVSRLQSSMNISPCGVAFVKQEVRPGILPDMLDEILSTRLMVKKSMKENSSDKTLQRVLHARQLGLKLIANVTYGYTSANFSGRMPCIEVGDSVVSKGRETLERAIEMVTGNEKWAAKVIYGDTDSLFVMLPGRTKEEAFRIGVEIAEAVTNDNPKPIKLKFEKVYYPCILQTKKRYVGYMYESLGQKEPVYDAKGIETVRRDGCPAVSKILEKSLKLLFERNDVNCVKQYVQRQFAKLVSGRLSIQELTFAREYRGMNNYKPAACVPALQLARRAILRDRRSEPRVKERVRYVLTVGAPGVPLIKSVCTPEEFLSTPGAIINAEYYITRAIIPALERCFSLIGVDVKMWYTELPRKRNLCAFVEDSSSSKICKKTISHYFTTSKCVACEEISISKVCTNCQKNPPKVALTVGSTINTLQRRHNYLQKICRSCTLHNGGIECSSLDCAVYYSRHQAARDAEQVPSLEKLQQAFSHYSNTNDR